jgi:Na+-driven multidrug efflux pump
MMAGWVLVILSYVLVIGFALAWAIAFAAVAYTVSYVVLMALLWLYEERPIRRWLKRGSTPVQE